MIYLLSKGDFPVRKLVGSWNSMEFTIKLKTVIFLYDYHGDFMGNKQPDSGNWILQKNLALISTKLGED